MAAGRGSGPVFFQKRASPVNSSPRWPNASVSIRRSGPTVVRPRTMRAIPAKSVVILACRRRLKNSLNYGFLVSAAQLMAVGRATNSQFISISLLRSSSDSTYGGASSKHDRLLVVLPGQAPPESTTAPVMVLERCGDGVCMRPLEDTRGFSGQVGPMPVGNHAAGGADFAVAVCGFVGRPFLWRCTHSRPVRKPRTARPARRAS